VSVREFSTRASRSVDRARLEESLAAAGLRHGRHVLVNCAMGQLGWIEGGAPALLAALRAVIGPDATVVTPTQTANNSTSSPIFRNLTRGMTRSQRNAFVKRMPGFDRRTTPSFRMGMLAEYVRTADHAVRSAHPQTSFAAIGPDAGELMRVHRLDCHLGEHSPLGALYAAGASVLLLGVGFEHCTMLHLAEYRVPGQRRIRRYRCFVERGDGRRVRRDFRAVDLDDSDFRRIGEHLRSRPFVTEGPVGMGQAIVMPAREAVDATVDWMKVHRSNGRGW
jgi:aminoglycoside 3-N-acetyltransferase